MNTYKVLFFATVIILIISNLFLIRKNNIDIKNAKDNCSSVSVPAVISPYPEIFCGGIAGTLCPSGYQCQLDGSYPDAGGKCLKSSSNKNYSCPENEWVDCMPSPDQPKNYQCEKPFLNWAKANCPNFKGAAL